MSLLECSHFYNNKYKNACQIKKRLTEPLFSLLLINWSSKLLAFDLLFFFFNEVYKWQHSYQTAYYRRYYPAKSLIE